MRHYLPPHHHTPPPNYGMIVSVHITTMDHFTTTAQIDEHPLTDITFMSDEELAALLEVPVDQLLGEFGE
jgi:hypothetical protein